MMRRLSITWRKSSRGAAWPTIRRTTGEANAPIFDHPDVRRMLAGMKARIEIRLKPGILDPQGKAIGGALAGLGYGGLGDVRQGKLIEIALNGVVDRAEAAKQLDAMCRTLLANPVTEDYTVELTD